MTHWVGRWAALAPSPGWRREAAVFLLVAIAGGWAAGASEWAAASFFPFNGHFQNYWTLARLSAGEFPFRDFPAYLGAGHLYAAWPLFWILGGDFRAATAAHNALHGAMLASSVVLACRLLGWRWVPSLIVAAVSFRVFSGFLGSGWSSVLGFRSFLPCLVALLVLVVPTRDSRGRALLYGGAAGLFPLWSNDYGWPALIAAWAMPVLAREWRSLAPMALASALSLAAGAALAAGGNPLDWLRSAVLAPSAAQAWYFNPIVEDKTYSLLDFPWGDGAFLSALGLCALFGLRVLLGRGGRRERAFLALLAAALGGFALSCLAGTHEERYSIPLWRYTLPGLATAVAMGAVAAPAFARRRYGGFFSHPLFGGAMAASLALMVFSAMPLPFQMNPDMDLARRTAMVVRVPALGLDSWPEVARAAALGEGFRRDGKSMVSTYSGPVSAGAGSLQAPSPYIIHAFSTPGGLETLARALLDPATAVSETLDHESLFWGLWAVRMHWALHRELFRTRRPFAGTGWSILWEARDTPLEPRPARCEVVAADGARPEVRVSDPSADPRPWWADVRLEIDASFRPTAVPVAGRVSVLSLTEGDDPPEGATMGETVRARWTSPLASGVLETPVVVGGGADLAARLRLESWPRGRSSVRIVGCSAELVAPVGETVFHAHRPMEMEARTTTGRPAASNEARGRMRLWLLNPHQAAQVRSGDVAVLPDGRHLLVLDRDFGLIEVPLSGPPPPPGTPLRILRADGPRGG